MDSLHIRAEHHVWHVVVFCKTTCKMPRVSNSNFDWSGDSQLWIFQNLQHIDIALSVLVIDNVLFTFCAPLSLFLDSIGLNWVFPCFTSWVLWHWKSSDFSMKCACVLFNSHWHWWLVQAASFLPLSPSIVGEWKHALIFQPSCDTGICSLLTEGPSNSGISVSWSIRTLTHSFFSISKFVHFFLGCKHDLWLVAAASGGRGNIKVGMLVVSSVVCMILTPCYRCGHEVLCY